jgi:hypothetical protein
VYPHGCSAAARASPETWKDQLLNLRFNNRATMRVIARSEVGKSNAKLRGGRTYSAHQRSTQRAGIQKERVWLIDELYGRFGNSQAAEDVRRIRRSARRDERHSRKVTDQHSRRKS